MNQFGRLVMKKHDHDLEQFQHDMDGLTEKAEIIELARLGYNAKQACRELKLSPEIFRTWWDADGEFRTAVYQAVVAVYLESPYK